MIVVINCLVMRFLSEANGRFADPNMYGRTTLLDAE